MVIGFESKKHLETNFFQVLFEYDIDNIYLANNSMALFVFGNWTYNNLRITLFTTLLDNLLNPLDFLFLSAITKNIIENGANSALETVFV